MTKDSSVIIVTYNSQETIRKCLDSLLRYSPEVEIIVADNHSQDQTVKIIKSYQKKVHFINNDMNLGFARASNLGVGYSQGEYLVFLNPDTRLIQVHSLEWLREALKKNPDFGLIGPQFIFQSGEVQRSVRNLPNFIRAFQEYILGIKEIYDFYLPSCQSLCEVESVTGACVVIKKDVFIRAGKFDERYFMYFEDLELCKAIRKLGLKVGYLPKVQIEHIVGASGEGKKTSEYFYQSARKYHGLLEYYLIQAIIRLGNILKS